MSDHDPGAGDNSRARKRDAVLLLAVVLACIYALDAAAVIDVLPVEAAVLFGIAALQAAWLVAARNLHRRALLAGAVLNAALVAIWVISRTVGLPVGPSGPQPLGLLDTLCALDSAATVVLTIALARRGGSGVRLARPAFVQSRGLAIVLALASLSALHSSTAGGAPKNVNFATGFAGAAGHRYHYFCQLL